MLNRFEPKPYTADFLKRTNYASDEVFGDIPRWLLERFVHNNGPSLMIKPKPVSKPNTNYSNSNQTKRKILTPQSQNTTNQRNNSSDTSVFHNAKQYNKGGGKPYDKPRGKGRGS